MIFSHISMVDVLLILFCLYGIFRYNKPTLLSLRLQPTNLAGYLLTFRADPSTINKKMTLLILEAFMIVWYAFEHKGFYSIPVVALGLSVWGGSIIYLGYVQMEAKKHIHLSIALKKPTLFKFKVAIYHLWVLVATSIIPLALGSHLLFEHLLNGHDRLLGDLHILFRALTA